MVLGAATIQVAVASHTTQSPEVLILTPRAIAPTEYLEGDEVLTRMDIFRDIELRRDLCILTISHELSVHPEVDTRGDTAKVGNHLLSFPGCRKRDGLTIRAHMVVLHRYRDIADTLLIVGLCQLFEMTAPSEADIQIHGIAKAVHFPNSRHGHLAPLGVVVVSTEEIGGSVRCVLHPVEFPVTMQ